jgi:hypothetical protein
MMTTIKEATMTMTEIYILIGRIIMMMSKGLMKMIIAIKMIKTSNENGNQSDKGFNGDNHKE